MRAISANTNCVVMADGAVARVSSGTQAGAVVGAILDHAVWLVIRDRSGYALHRKRMPLGELLLVIAERGALFVAGCGLHVADLDQEILCGCHPRERRRG